MELPEIPNFFALPREVVVHRLSDRGRSETASLRRQFLDRRDQHVRSAHITTALAEHGMTTPQIGIEKQPEHAQKVMGISDQERPHETTRCRQSKTANQRSASGTGIRSGCTKNHVAGVNFNLKSELVKRVILERPAFFVQVHANPRPKFDYPEGKTDSSTCVFLRVGHGKEDPTTRIRRIGQVSARLSTERVPDSVMTLPKAAPTGGNHLNLNKPGIIRGKTDTELNIITCDQELTIRGLLSDKQGSEHSTDESCSKYPYEMQRSNCPRSRISLSADKGRCAIEISDLKGLKKKDSRTSSHIQYLQQPLQTAWTDLVKRKNTSTCGKANKDDKIYAEACTNKRQPQEMASYPGNDQISSDAVPVISNGMKGRYHFIHPEWISEQVGWDRYGHRNNPTQFRYSWM